MLGSINQGRFGASRRSWRSVVHPTYTRHHLAGRHHEYRGTVGLTLMNRLSVRPYAQKTGNARPCVGMPPSVYAYRAAYQRLPSDWRRRPGRPRQQTWLATTRCDLKQLNIDVDHVPDLATDRALWRGLVRGAGAAPFWRMLMITTIIAISVWSESILRMFDCGGLAV